jgi:hypothetical protein
MMMASNFCIFLTSTPATTNEAATGTENLAVDAACSDAPVYQADAQIGHETRRPAYIKIGITRHPQFLEQTDIQTSASVEIYTQPILGIGRAVANVAVAVDQGFEQGTCLLGKWMLSAAASSV